MLTVVPRRLTEREFRQARTAFSGRMPGYAGRAVITPALHAHLLEIVGDLLPRMFLPNEVVPDPDDADPAVVLSEWMNSRPKTGIQSGPPPFLLKAFHQTVEPKRFRRYLEQTFRNWVISQGRGKEPRLYIRTAEILATNAEFECFGPNPRRKSDAWWGLAKWHPHGRPTYTGDFRRLAAIARDLLLREVKDKSTRTSPRILPTPEIKRLVAALFTDTDSLLQLTHFGRLYKLLWPWAYRGRVISLDDPSGVPVASDDPDIHLGVARGTVLEILTRHELELLLALRECSREEVAEQLGIKPTQVTATGRDCAARLAAAGHDEAELKEVLDGLGAGTGAADVSNRAARATMRQS